MVHSRNKGCRGERQIVKLLKAWWGSEFFRTPRSGAFATQGFVHEDMNLAGDVMTPDKTFPFGLEVKWREGWHLEQLITSTSCPIWKWWNQCVSETPVGMIPLLLFTRNHQPWFYIKRQALCSKMWQQESPSMLIIAPDNTVVLVGLFEDLLKTEVEDWKKKR